MIITVGIDVAKDKLDIWTEQVKYTTIGNGISAIKRYFKDHLQGEQQVRIAMESTKNITDWHIKLCTSLAVR